MNTLDPSDLPADATVLVVNTLAINGMPPPMPGCEHRDCYLCRRLTWAAPSTLAAEKVRALTYLCLTCATALDRLVGGLGEPDRLPGADADVNAPGSRVTRESEEALGRSFRRQ